MSPKAVTLGHNTAHIIEVPGQSDRTYSRIIEWEDTDLDGNTIKSILQLDRHGNTFTVRMEEWNTEGEFSKPIRHMDGYLKTSEN